MAAKKMEKRANQLLKSGGNHGMTANEARPWISLIVAKYLVGPPNNMQK